MRLFFIFLGLFTYGAIIVNVMIWYYLEKPYIDLWRQINTGVLTISALVASALLWKNYVLHKQQTAWNIVLQLCNHYTSILEQTSAKSQGRKGRDGLEQLVNDDIIDWAMANDWTSIEGNTTSEVRGILIVAEGKFNSYEVCFQLLYCILEYIDNIKISEKEKQRYAQIPRALLSNVELEALLIYCLTPGGDDMKKYIEQFHILNNYTPVYLLNEHADKFKEEYKKIAFESNKAKSFGIINFF